MSGARDDDQAHEAGFWRRTWAMLIKEFIQLRRDRVTFAMILFVPLMQLLLFGYAINTTPRNLPMAVLMQENSDVGRSILAALEVRRDFQREQHGARRQQPVDFLFGAREMRDLEVFGVLERGEDRTADVAVLLHQHRHR